jgi:lysozyme family protein
MSFDKALKHILSNFEGGYANSTKDSGGETFRGISRKTNPSWPGWPTVDKAKLGIGPDSAFVNNKGAWKKVDAATAGDTGLEAAVSDLYRDKYYTPLLKYGFPQRLLDKMLDLRINMAPLSGNTILQKALVASGQPISVDGAIGPKTLTAAKAVALDELLKNICEAQFAFYENGVLKKFPNSEAHFRERANWIPAED